MSNRPTLLLALLCLLAICGCFRTVKVRHFGRVLPVRFEHWRFDVDLRADPRQSWEEGKEGPEHHLYSVQVMGSTFHGMAVTGSSDSFRETDYEVYIDSLRLTHDVDGEAVELPIGEVGRSRQQDGRVATLAASERIPIDPHIRKLRADLTITLTHRETGEVQTKTFDFALPRKEASFPVPDLGP